MGFFSRLIVFPDEDAEVMSHIACLAVCKHIVLLFCDYTTQMADLEKLIFVRFIWDLA